MVLNNTFRTAITSSVLSAFSGVGDIGFSSDLNSESPSSDFLTAEFLRKPLTEVISKPSLGEKEFEGVLGLTEGNGELLSKVGFYASVLAFSKVLPSSIAKDDAREVSVGYRLKIDVVDAT